MLVMERSRLNEKLLKVFLRFCVFLCQTTKRWLALKGLLTHGSYFLSMGIIAANLMNAR